MLFAGKEGKEKACFTRATIMRKLFNVIKKSFLALDNAIKDIKWDKEDLRNYFDSLYQFPHTKKTFQHH